MKMDNVLLGEFVGTAVLIAFGCGVVANVSLKESKGLGAGGIVVYTGWAMAVVMGVSCGLAIGNTGDLNTAITFFKLLLGVFTASCNRDYDCTTFPVYCRGRLVWLAYLPH